MPATFRLMRLRRRLRMRRRCASLSAADSHCIREQSARSTGRVLPRPCYPLLDCSLGLPTARRVPFQELFELRKKVKTRQQVRAAPFQTATPYRASTHRCIPVPRSPGEAAPVYTHEAPHWPAAHAALAACRLKHAANGGSRLGIPIMFMSYGVGYGKFCCEVASIVPSA